MGEGSLPMKLLQLERMVAFVKYIGTCRRVTHPMMMARTYATDPVTMENRNGAMVIARQLEWSMFMVTLNWDTKLVKTIGRFRV